MPLRRRQLLSYGAMALRVRELEIMTSFRAMWRRLFPDVPVHGTGDLLAFTATFCGLCNERLFPVDFEILDEVYGWNGDVVDVIGVAIPYVSWGVPYECLPLEELAAWARPLAAVLLVQYREDGSAAEYWEDAGVTFPEKDLTWHTHELEALALLERLEPPLDGLAVAFQAVMRSAANPFIDDVGPMWRVEYWEECNEFYWDLGDILSLARHWDHAKPRVERLKAYTQWFDEHQDAATQVLNTFVRLEEAWNT